MGPLLLPLQKTVYGGLESGLGIGEGVPLRLPGRRGPHPHHPVGTVGAARNPLVAPSARQVRRPRQAGRSVWDVRRRERGGRTDVEGRGADALSSSGGRTAWDPEQVDQLVLNRDHGPGGGDPIWCRCGRVKAELPEAVGGSPQPQDHLAGQRCPRQTQHHPAPRSPARQALPVGRRV